MSLTFKIQDHSIYIFFININIFYFWKISKSFKPFHINNVYKYIELFAVPDSYNKYISIWKDLKIPYVIHAPHFACGLNLAKKESKIKNFKLIKETLKFADELKAEIIIFHPGTDGDIKETVSQLNFIKDSRIVIENKPYYALVNNLICNGHSPEEIKFIMENAKVGFCFDIGHAICSANAQRKNVFNFLNDFKKLNPKLYHLTDNDFYGIYDEHRHFGQGNYDLKKIIKLFHDNCLITVETDKNFQNSLKDYKDDIIFLINLF